MPLTHLEERFPGISVAFTVLHDRAHRGFNISLEVITSTRTGNALQMVTFLGFMVPNEAVSARKQAPPHGKYARSREGRGGRCE